MGRSIGEMLIVMAMTPERRRILRVDKIALAVNLAASAFNFVWFELYHYWNWISLIIAVCGLICAGVCILMIQYHRHADERVIKMHTLSVRRDKARLKARFRLITGRGR
jgi:hypothetical protein